VGLGAARDTIADFASAQRDQLDFSTFLVGTREVDFYFVGSKGFTAGDGHVGELSFAKGILSGDYNNDARADFQIVLSGVTRLSDKDFDGLLLA
jgi:serralysin